MDVLEGFKKDFFSSILRNYGVAPELLSQITFLLGTDVEKRAIFGDISSNAALVLGKAYKENPRVIAEKIIEGFKNRYIEKVEIAGPGFLNFTLNLSFFEEILNELLELREQFFKLSEIKDPIKYSIEFVSANPTGPLHLGHGRGGIIGDVLGNILRFLGYKVTKEFYVNDAGFQIEKLGLSFKVRCQQLLGVDIDLPEDAYHGSYLVDLAKNFLVEYKDRDEYGDLVSALKCVQGGESGRCGLFDDFLTDYAKNALLQNIRDTLDSYGINFDVWFSEKSLYESGDVEKAVNILSQKGLTYQMDGALWFSSSKFGDDKDRVLKKSDGKYTYFASDAAYIISKVLRGAGHLILVLGQDHHSYITRLKALMLAFGYGADKIDTIIYQLVTLKEGEQQVRMSKRKGKMVSLEDVIESVGRDVARFFYLNRKAEAHLEFDINLALKRTDENPVYYAQYAYVRAKSILEKAAQEFPEFQNLTNNDIKGLDYTECSLLKKIVSLKELLENISKNYHTHLLTYYLLELCQIFHSYYREHKIIDSGNIERSRARLLLLTCLFDTLTVCFRLLEIGMPERM